MSNKNIFILIIVLLVLGMTATILLRGGGKSVVSTKYDTFAQCIASKNLTMYGAAWCPHCKDQKALFEGSFKYVPYVECTENPNLCLEKGVNRYPTWIEEKGTRYEEVLSLQKLSELTNCVLPNN